MWALLCYKWKYFCTVGSVQEKRPKHLLMVYRRLNSAMILQEYKKVFARLHNLNLAFQNARKPYSNVHLEMSYCKALCHSKYDLSLNIMSTNCYQNNRANTPENTFQANLWKKKFHWMIFIRLRVIILWRLNCMHFAHRP